MALRWEKKGGVATCMQHVCTSYVSTAEETQEAGYNPAVDANLSIFEHIIDVYTP